MDPGNLTQQITLQQRSSALDGFGQSTGVWVNLATVWASVLPLRGREFFAAAQVQQELSVKVTMRYRSDLTPAHRILWRGRAYDITACIDLGGRREWLEVMALEGVKDGR